MSEDKCPFCGSRNITSELFNLALKGRYLACDDCKMQFPIDKEERKKYLKKFDLKAWRPGTGDAYGGPLRKAG